MGMKTENVVELTARKMVGEWTGSVGYAFGVSRMMHEPPPAEGDEDAPVRELRFPSSTDIRHSFDAMGSLRVSDAFTVGGALTSGSKWDRTLTEVRRTSIGWTTFGI